MSTEGATYEMFLTREFDAPVERVWQAWSDAGRVRQWWGPNGFTAPVAEIDFREGGKSLVCMRAPEEYGGMDMYNTWTYTKIEPHSRIEFVQHFSDADGVAFDPAQQPGVPAGIPFEVPHVITFRPLDGGRTELTVTEYGYADEQVAGMSKGGMAQCLDKMAASLAAG